MDTQGLKILRPASGPLSRPVEKDRSLMRSQKPSGQRMSLPRVKGLNSNQGLGAMARLKA